MGEEVKRVILCSDGTRAQGIWVLVRGDGAKFVYGWTYDRATKRTKNCYVAPADPAHLFESMPRGFLYDAGVWAGRLAEALMTTIDTARKYEANYVVDELVKALSRVLEAAGYEVRAKASPQGTSQAPQA